MKPFQAVLGPKQVGIEILVCLARQRATGVLSFGTPNKPRKLSFREGRPESGIDADGQVLSQHPQVVQLLRAFAVVTSGRCAFLPGEVGSAPSLGIDTLGESLVAAMQLLPSVQLEGILAARANLTVEATPLFAKLVRAMTQISGIVLAPPDPGTVSSLTGKAEPAMQRAWVAQLLLGGIKAEPWALVFEAPASPATAAAASASAPSGAEAPPVGSLRHEIDVAHARLASQSHYEFLNVAPDANVETIRKAYFEMAKRWHADRLVGAHIDAEGRRKASELFHRADEANRVLSQAEERKTYDWVLQRQAQGLPTDPRVVMEAEALFHRGEGLIRRGQAAAAEPLLRQAVQLNKGEAEFWAYLGFAIYGVSGAGGLAESLQCLQKALEMRQNLDVAHEFLGRIYSTENDRGKAHHHLEAALELNPKNTHAERELRLLSMRQEQEKQADKDKGFLGRFLKR